jgi:creatinine amidohydrolase
MSDIVEFGLLTYEEIRDLSSLETVVIVPTGCTEQQGPHLPVDFDTWFSYALSVEGARRAVRHGIRALVLPALPFGPTPEHRGFGHGYIHVPQTWHEDGVVCILTSLAEQGFSRFLIWKGCGGHRPEKATERFLAVFSSCTVHVPEQPYGRIWRSIGVPEIPCGHADSFTTSIALWKRPEMVRKERIFDPGNREPDWADPDLDFSRYSSSGVIGDPTHASPELGARLWEACVEELVKEILRLAKK